MAKIKTFADASSMYDSLNSGSVDAVMDDEPVVKYSISQGQKLKLQSRELLSEILLCSEKGSNPELIQMFNNGLANIKKNGQYQKFLINI